MIPFYIYKTGKKFKNSKFLRKNLKVKKAYLGDFLAKNEKNNYDFGVFFQLFPPVLYI